MGDFQQYLDNALDRLDVNENKRSDDQIQKLDYNVVYEVAELVATTRKEMGISQQELSEKTGIPQANISKIENGNYTPSLSILKRLADGLGRRLVIDFIDTETQLEG